MWYFATSFVLFLIPWVASNGAISFSYLSDDFALALGILSILCVIFFLLGIVVAVLVNTNGRGELHSPQSISALACIILLVPQGGFAIGMLLNYEASLEIFVAVKDSPGAAVYFEQGFFVLDGEIGHVTLSSLQSVLDMELSSTLLLRSEGGLLDIGMEIGEILREKKIDVFVSENCESACVIIALSGESLIVTRDARFGFHRASAVASNNSQLGRFIGNDGTEDYLSALDALGVPESILIKTRNTAPSDMYYLSGAEMVNLGLAIE